MVPSRPDKGDVANLILNTKRQFHQGFSCLVTSDPFMGLQISLDSQYTVWVWSLPNIVEEEDY